jgi:uncharacterized protein YkwD
MTGSAHRSRLHRMGLIGSLKLIGENIVGMTEWVRKEFHLSRAGMIIAAVIVGNMLTACTPLTFPTGGLSEETYAGQNVFKAKPTIGIDELEQRIHELINQERAKHGLSLLAWNPILNKVARKHSQDMAQRHYFGHDSLEGHDLSYRYSQQGFVCEVQASAMFYTGGENIYQSNLYSSVEYVNNIPVAYNWNDLGKIAQTTVRGWMNSPTHRKGILEPSWRTEGIGAALSNDGKVYITQDFC